MEERVNFIAYCAEIYKESKNLSGKLLAELFEKYGVWEFIYDYFEPLHVTAPLYTIECINEHITSFVQSL